MKKGTYALTALDHNSWNVTNVIKRLKDDILIESFLFPFFNFPPIASIILEICQWCVTISQKDIPKKTNSNELENSCTHLAHTF